MASKKGEVVRRRGNFMSEPSKGWLHNEAALGHGHGVYFCYPVKYLGAMQVLKSLSDLKDTELKTEICREAIARVAEFSKNRKPSKRKIPKECKDFLADTPFIKVMEIRLNISCDGIATANKETQEIIANDDISKISFAAGGDAEDYTLITYVSKDRRNNRYCHVFDCGVLSDDVLATLGQAFTLITKPKSELRGVDALKAAPKVAMDNASNPGYFAMHTSAGPGPSLPPRPPSLSRADAPLPPPPSGKRAPPLPPGGPPSTMAPPLAKEILDSYNNGNLKDKPVSSAYDNNPIDFTQMRQALPTETYDDMSQPKNVAEVLNVTAQSQHLYGDDVDIEAIYGDAELPKWNYLSFDPEKTYGGLADIYG